VFVVLFVYFPGFATTFYYSPWPWWCLSDNKRFTYILTYLLTCPLTYHSHTWRKTHCSNVCYTLCLKNVSSLFVDSTEKSQSF